MNAAEEQQTTSEGCGPNIGSHSPRMVRSQSVLLGEETTSDGFPGVFKQCANREAAAEVAEVVIFRFVKARESEDGPI